MSLSDTSPGITYPYPIHILVLVKEKSGPDFKKQYLFMMQTFDHTPWVRHALRVACLLCWYHGDAARHALTVACLCSYHGDAAGNALTVACLLCWYHEDALDMPWQLFACYVDTMEMPLDMPWQLLAVDTMEMPLDMPWQLLACVDTMEMPLDMPWQLLACCVDTMVMPLHYVPNCVE